jgi:hypothetical protein
VVETVVEIDPNTIMIHYYSSLEVGFDTLIFSLEHLVEVGFDTLIFSLEHLVEEFRRRTEVGFVAVLSPNSS